MKPITPSKLRADIYRLLDDVLETGMPLEVKRKGRILKIVPAEPVDRLERLVERKDFIRCDPDELVHMDWSGEWRP